MSYPIYKVVEKVTTYETHYLPADEIGGLPQTVDDPSQWEEWAADAIEGRQPDAVFYDGNRILEVTGCHATGAEDYEYYKGA